VLVIFSKASAKLATKAATKGKKSKGAGIYVPKEKVEKGKKPAKGSKSSKAAAKGQEEEEEEEKADPAKDNQEGEEASLETKPEAAVEGAE